MTTSFKEKLIVTAKEIYDENPTSMIKDTLNNFLSTMKILDSLLINDEIGLRSIEHYLINEKFVALDKDNKVYVLPCFYNEIKDMSKIPTKYDTIKEYIKSECQIN